MAKTASGTRQTARPAKPAAAVAPAKTPRPARPKDEFAPETRAERRLLEAAATTGTLDVSGLPAADRVVRPAFFRALVAGRIPGHAPPDTGLLTIGLVFKQKLDLDHLSADGDPLPPLAVADARFESGFRAAFAHFSMLSLARSTVMSGAVMGGIQTSGDIRLENLNCSGGLNLTSARIGGDVNLNGARLEGPPATEKTEQGQSLMADQISIRGGLFCRAVGGRFEAHGEIRLMGADIGGQVNLNGARLFGPVDANGRVVGDAFSADGSTIGGDLVGRVMGDHRLEVYGPFRLLGTNIGGDISLNGAYFQGRMDDEGRVVGFSLSADRVAVTGGVFCRPMGAYRFESEGSVRFDGATIGGSLTLDGADLKNALSEDDRGFVSAFSADRAVIGGDAFFDFVGGRQFSAEGEIRLPGARIGGVLSFSHARLTAAVNDKGRVIGNAISAHGVEVGDKTSLDEDCVVTGAVRLCGARLRDIVIKGTFLSAGDAVDLTDTEMRRLMVQHIAPASSGRFLLEGARADTIDALVPELWGSPPTVDNKGVRVDLDGFTYRRAEVASGDRTRARRWARFLHSDPITENVLDLIDRGFPGKKPHRAHFLPHVFEQATRALRDAGHGRAADEIAVAKREFQRESSAEGHLASAFALPWLVFFRYGYGWLRAAAWVVVFTILGGWAFSAIHEGGGLVLAETPKPGGGPPAVHELKQGPCRPGDPIANYTGCARMTYDGLAWTTGNLERHLLMPGLELVLGKPDAASPRTAERTALLCPEHPLALALDTFLPLVDFGVEKRCRIADDYPRRGLAEAFRILYAIFGWLFIPMVALTFSGVLRKD